MSLYLGSWKLMRQPLTIPVPNPTAWTKDSASPIPNRDMLSDKEKDDEISALESSNSKAATPDKHRKAACDEKWYVNSVSGLVFSKEIKSIIITISWSLTSHVCGASFIPIGFLSTNHCRIGHTITVADPKNDTNAGDVSTNATLCET